MHIRIKKGTLYLVVILISIYASINFMLAIYKCIIGIVIFNILWCMCRLDAHTAAITPRPKRAKMSSKTCFDLAVLWLLWLVVVAD